MSRFIVAMTNQVERTQRVSLRNNEQQNQRQAYLKMFEKLICDRAHRKCARPIRLGSYNTENQRYVWQGLVTEVAKPCQGRMSVK